MSIKTVNALSHYTDWTVGHVHSGALGWVGLISMGSLYYLIPQLFGRKEMYSVRAIELHFWIATIGIVLYIAAMWIAGVMQGLMWRAINPDGTLVYTFVESVKATYPVLRDAAARRPAVPERHADHGLEHGDDGARAARSRWRRCPPSPRRTPDRQAKDTSHGATTSPYRSREDRDQQLPDDRADPAHRRGRRHRRDRAAVLPEVDHAAGRGPQALHRAAAGRPRHLHPRGLLQLPLADGAAVPLRDAALRRSSRVAGEYRLRPPVPVGQQAHRPRPAARRRQVQRRMAPHPPDQPARPGARVEHAGLSLAASAPRVDPADMAPKHEGAAHWSACPTPTRRSPRPARPSRARPSWRR